MKVLFYSNMGLAPIHLGMELELMKQVKLAGNDIHVLKCDNGIDSCFFNPCHNLLGCAICTARTDRFHQQIGIKEENIHTIKKLAPTNLDIPLFNSLKELLQWKYKGINIGRGIASSTISLERDYGIFEDERQAELLAVQAKSAINVLLNFEQVLASVQPDMVYLFNGRFAEQFPLLELCSLRKIEFKTYECGSTKQKYQVFDNALPHSLEGIKNIMTRLWNEAEENSRKKIAEEWYTTKRLGTSVNRVNFIKDQQSGRLPENFDKSKRNFVFFNSSEDEMKAIGEWENPLYSNQNDVIEKTLAYFNEHHPTFHFYVRMHPNLAKVDSVQTKGLYAMKSSNFTLIRPKDSVDSFGLVDACEKIISFGSTIGLETTFWGQPSILFGKAFYEGLDAVYIPDSYEAFFELLKKPNLAAKPKENTYPFAYYLEVCGIPFEYFNYDGKLNSQFENTKMDRITLSTIFHFLRSLGQLGNWKKLNKIVLGRSLGFKDFFKLKSHTLG